MPYREIVLMNGGRIDFRIRTIDSMEGFIKKNKLGPVVKEHLTNMMPMAVEAEPFKA